MVETPAIKLCFIPQTNVNLYNKYCYLILFIITDKTVYAQSKAQFNYASKKLRFENQNFLKTLPQLNTRFLEDVTKAINGVVILMKV